MRDTKVEAEIDALIARMTDAQKVGQLIQADISAVTRDADGKISKGLRL